MTPDLATQQGLSIIIACASVIAEYIVSLVVPQRHFPKTAGILVAMMIVAGLSYAGIQAASDFLTIWATILGVLAVSCAMNEGWGE
jgi:hypothetical protein